MKISPAFRSVRLLLVTLAASSAALHAHPGHEGDGLTWDLRHLAAHPLATVGCLFVAAVVAWLTVTLIRSGTINSVARAKRNDSR